MSVVSAPCTADFSYANTPPIAETIQIEVSQNQPKDIVLQGSDPDGDPIVYTIVSYPAYGALTGALPDLTYTPSAEYYGADSFTFKVNDGAADSEIATIFIIVTPDVTLDVYAEEEIRDIYPTVIGGNEVYHYSSILWLMYDYSKDSNLSKMCWRVHLSDNGWGIKWDTNLIDQRSVISTYNLEGLNGSSQVFVPPDGFYTTYDNVDHNQGNKFVVDYWEATDMDHSGVVIKGTQAANAYQRVIFAQKPAIPLYVRLDVKIDSARTFRSINSGWVLLNNDNNFEVRFTNDRRLDIRCRDTLNKIKQLALSPVLELDRYYSIEVYYGNNECAYWLDGSEIDRASLTTRANIQEVDFGSVRSDIAGAEGQIHVDALRVDDSYIGNNVKRPWQYPYKAVYTFDNNLRTIDDLAKMSERLGVTLLWGIPAPNKTRPGYVENTDATGWDWQTMQYYVDMVEYLDGVADPDYAEKVKTLDWTHSTPDDNWANLRAARGRVEPYNQIYFEFGNEPYYAGGWRWTDAATGQYVTDLDGYGNEFVAFATKVHAINGNIKLGIHTMSGGSNNDWFDKLLPIAHDHIGFISIFHYYLFYHDSVQGLVPPIEHWLGIPVGENNTWRYYLGNNRREWVQAPFGKSNPVEGADHSIYLPYYARFKIDQHLSDRPDHASIPLAITEYGYFGNAGYGEENWIGTAIHRASWIENNIKSGVAIGNSWSSLASQRFGHGIISLHNNPEGGIEITPSYYLFRMMADHLGTRLLKSDMLSTITPYWWQRDPAKDQPGQGFDIPYVTSWASIDAEKKKIYITFINRSQVYPANISVKLHGIVPSDTVKVFMLNGNSIGDDNEITNEGSRYTWWLPASDSNDNPNNIVTKEYSASITGNSFSYTIPKLSVTIFEITKSGVETNNGPIFTLRADGDGIRDTVINFGPSYGVWARYGNGSWERLHELSPDSMASGDIDGDTIDDIAMDFGPSYGIWVRYGNGSWGQLHNLSCEHMAICDLDGDNLGETAIDFGPDYGIWARHYDGTWDLVSDVSPESIATGDIDGNGKDDMVIDFGASYGIWARHDDGTWDLVSDVSPDLMAAGDLDGDGKDDLVIDFGTQHGIWVRYGNGNWEKIHDLST
ncbi:MAG: Ig-like domain-containing protein [Candidatus Omnitrophota bacterium]